MKIVLWNEMSKMDLAELRKRMILVFLAQKYRRDSVFSLLQTGVFSY